MPLKANLKDSKTVARLEREHRADADCFVWDENLSGFGLRIRNGKATWFVQYKIGQRHRRFTLGTTAMLKPDEARNGWQDKDGNWHDGAALILAGAKQGTDAAAKRAEVRGRNSKLLGAMVADYLAVRIKDMRPRTYEEAERHLNEHFKPLHKSALASVTRGDVAARVRKIAEENGPVAANRARASLSAFYRWCIGEGLCDANPVAGTNKQEENGPRERTLSDQEAAAVWLAAPENDYGRIVRLLLLTGCRRDEIGSLQWSEYDSDAKTITIAADRTKNGKAHVVPLCESALAILEAISGRADRIFVFGKGKGGFSGWSKSKAAFDMASGVKGWTLHDLRRTVRTGLGNLGVAPHVAEAVLNHLPPRLIRTYDRNTYAVEKRAALDLWANHLLVEVSKVSGGNVASLRDRAAQVREAARRATPSA